ncbi:MAG: hypothetical protein HY532_08485 [Chloroflexi bacterium]|nr:hypothetical protein [Chloroflexota bacterium]
MNKRFSSLVLFGVAALLLTLIGALAALAAPSGVAGTIVLDKSWYTNAGAGSAVKITVTDADYNIPNDQAPFDVTVAAEAQTTGQFVQLNPGIVGTPRVAVDGTTTLYPTSQAQAPILNAELGRVTLLVDGVTVTAGMEVDIIYQTSAVDTVAVKVVSTQDPTGFTVNATETGVNTGVFELNINLVTTFTSITTTPPQLVALNGNTLTASYTDTLPAGAGSASVTRSVSSQVETSGPTFSNIAPAHNFATQLLRPTFTFSVSDAGGSGIKVNTVQVVITNGSAPGTYAASAVGTVNDGATSANFTFTPGADLALANAETDISWYVQATDVAGNMARSDRDAATAGDQNHTVRIDNVRPALNSAETGRWWDTSVSPAVEKSDRLTSLVAIFSEALDSATVSGADFTVTIGGVAQAIVDATNYSGASTKVYINLANPIAADAKPVVGLAAGQSVQDKGGNAATSANTPTVTSLDKIKPTFTLAISPAIIKATQSVTVTLSANEPISGVPVITVRQGAAGAGTVTTLSTIVVTATSWTATFTGASASAHEGKNAVFVTGNDTAVPQNTGTAGVDDSTSTATAARIFTLDTTAPAVAAAAAGGVSILAGTPNVGSLSPFVTITYGEKVTLTKVEFGVAGGTLTDVTAQTSLSTSGLIAIYAASGLTANTSYSIRITVADLAVNSSLPTTGNTYSFKAIVKPKVDIPLKPGNNLISLPSEPASGAINTVIVNPDVQSVITYDPLNPDPVTGPWKSATRNAAGSLAGSLTVIDSRHAYWVNTTSFAPISVDIPEPGFQATPPSIPLVAGWNMVPIVSLIGQAPSTLIPADQYFASVPNWVTAYTYDPQANTWTKIVPKAFMNVVVGLGYWLYTTVPAILVP